MGGIAAPPMLSARFLGNTQAKYLVNKGRRVNPNKVHEILTCNNNWVNLYCTDPNIHNPNPPPAAAAPAAAHTVRSRRAFAL